MSGCDGLPPRMDAELRNDARLSRNGADAAPVYGTAGRALAPLRIHDLLRHSGNKVLPARTPEVLMRHIRLHIKRCAADLDVPSKHQVRY